MTAPSAKLMAWFFGVFAACAAVFAAWPSIDIWISSQFYTQGAGFELEADPVLEGIRNGFWNIFLVAALVCLTMLIHHGLKRDGLNIPGRIWGFSVSLYILGPGLLVDVVLKGNSGRARPAQVTEFGGSADFTPAFQMTDQCARNCSFVSGEASGATATAIVIGCIGWTLVPRGLRGVFVALLFAFAAVPSLLRVVTGRHFMSDVVFSVLITALVALLLYRLFNLRQYQAQVTWGALSADARTLFADIAGAAVGTSKRIARVFGGKPKVTEVRQVGAAETDSDRS